MGDLAAFYKGKTLLITGSTGFLGKPLVEKILRALPGVRRIYLLVRAKGENRQESARKRVEKEILRSHVFTLLRESHGEAFKAFAADKVVAIPGDVSQPNLGLSDDDFQRLTSEVDVIINGAAVVVFDERLDYAVESNTMGPTRILEFAKRCRATASGRDPIFMHVSTAYVGGLRRGRVPEELQPQGRCVFDLMGVPTDQPFDLDEQIRDVIRASQAIEEEACAREQRGEFIAEAQQSMRNATQTDDRVREQAEKIRKRWIGDRLVKEGVSRARKFGWNDTYTFTKAMGEQMLIKNRGGVPTVILRPSIIESSYSEPEPGWIDGLRMADPLIAGYGKGRIPDFPVDPEIILDFIPVDFVVNALLAAVPTARPATGAQGPGADGSVPVFQVATSTENPLHFRELVLHTRDYFLRYPMRERNGKPIIPREWTFPSEEKFLKWVARTDAKLRLGQRACELLSFLPRTKRLRREFAATQAGLERLAYYNQIYGHYVRLHCQYETTNTRRLFQSLSREEQKQFFFDPGAIDWQEYLQEIHIPGLKRHILKIDEEAREPLATAPEAAPDEGTAEAEREEELHNLNQLLARAATRWPNKVAHQIKREGEWQQFTFAQLRDLALRAANGLRDRGVARGSRVVLISENQPEWVVAYFACMGLGAAVVPLDRQTRDDEVFAIADLVDASAIMASGTWLAKVKAKEACDRGVLNIDSWHWPAQPSPPTPLPLGEGGGVRVAPFHPIDPVEVEADELASIIFTTGTAIEAKGAMLSHRNFLSNVLALSDVLQPYETDQMLSILPLNHAFEFTCDLLVPMFGGATVTYIDSIKSRDVLKAMTETKTTCLLGIPRVFEILLESIQQRVAGANGLTRAAFAGLKLMSSLSLELSKKNVGRQLFAKVHEVFGGHLRILISGGAALDPKFHRDFTLMGFNLCEGYGLTETSPVLTVNPLEKSKPGSVGRALPGVRLRILNPDAKGIGEIVARGPNVFSGYFRNDKATEKVFRDGWFHTGDLGYLDNEGYLFITGRIKEVIVTPAGKNVYPDEVEALFKSVAGVREICVVGVRPPGQLGEEVHAVIVPSALPEAVQLGIQQASREVPSYQRLQKIHFWKQELPKTAAMQIDRPRVRELLAEERGRPEAAAPKREATKDTPDLMPAIIEVLARATQMPAGAIAPDVNLQFDLAIDSIKRIDLVLQLETRFRITIPDELAFVPQTVRDLVELVDAHLNQAPAAAAVVDGRSYWDRALAPDEATQALTHESGAIGCALRGVFRRWLRVAYRRRFRFEWSGLENIPDGPFIVAPNHTSHLDAPAVLLALEAPAPNLRVLGARDYFFNTRLKGWFCRTMLNVVPFDRHVNFMEGLRVGRALLERGHPLLVFPEGTRSPTGRLQPFKPGLGLLAFELDVPIVPAYVHGAYAAWPKGRALPARSPVSLRFGAPIRCDRFRAKASEATPYEIYQAIVNEVRAAIEELRAAEVAQRLE